ncbi:hypothetical protein FRC11_014112, partial [Ceratobasidium sp. 423]
QWTALVAPLKHNARVIEVASYRIHNVHSKISSSLDIRPGRHQDNFKRNLWDAQNLVPPWHVFFEEIFRKAGKPLPEQLHTVIERGKQKYMSGESIVEDLAIKTSKLGIMKNVSISTSTRPSPLDGKRLVSNSAADYGGGKRLKEGVKHSARDAAVTPDEELEGKDYIVVSD